MCPLLRLAHGAPYFVRERSSEVIFTLGVLSIGSHQMPTLWGIFPKATVFVIAFTQRLYNIFLFLSRVFEKIKARIKIDLKKQLYCATIIPDQGKGGICQMKIEKYGIAAVEYEVTDSTNERAKAYATGEWRGEPTLFIAEEQTKGRGRYSRKFHSKSGAGVYLSLLFKPESGINDTTSIIALAAISMINAINEEASADVKIKWVNDLILGCRKLGGILIEGAIDPLTKTYSYLIAGIGVNLYKTDFDKEIEDIATSLEGECGIKIDKTRLVRSFVRHFLEGISSPDSEELFDAYKNRLITVGKTVTVRTVTEEYGATAIGLNRDYSLSVKTDCGEEKRIYTGEVSVKAN